MEFCHCGSLGAFIRSRNRLTEEELREIASCCLLGLESLHAKSIIHGVRSANEDNGLECGSR